MAKKRSIDGSLRATDGLPLSGLRVELHRVVTTAPKRRTPDPESDYQLVAGSRSAKDGSFAFGLPAATPDDDDHHWVRVAVSGEDSDQTEGSTHRTPWRPEPLTTDTVVITVPDGVLTGGGPPRRPVLTGPRSRGELAAVGLRTADRTRESLFDATTRTVRRRVERRRLGGDLARRLLARRRPDPSDDGTYLPPGTPRGDRLEIVRTHGVERLADVPTRGMQLHLSAEDYDRLFEGGPVVNIPAPPWLQEQLDDLLGTAAGGSRLADLLAECRAAHTVAAFDPDGGAGGPATDGVSDGSAVDQHVDATAAPVAPGEPFPLDIPSLLAQVLSTDPATGLPARPDPASVRSALEAGLPPGPADTTAFYDFHRIQIAWQDVWTSALDDIAVGTVAAVYEEVVETVDPEVLGPDGGGIDEVAELEELLDAVSDAVAVAAGTPGLDAPADLVAWLPEVAGVWADLALEQQEWLRFLEWVDDDLGPWVRALPLVDFDDSVTAADVPIDSDWPDEWLESVHLDDLEHNASWGRDTARAFVDSVESPTPEGPATPGLARLESLLGELSDRLAEPHRFDLFVPDSYNYGLMTTIRQRWQPLEYQAGDLVASLPLAPGESREVETRQVLKTSRAQKEIEHSLSSRSGESTTTGRAQAEIVRKAVTGTNFSMTAEGSVSVDYGLIGASLSGGHSFGANQSSDSAQTKQDLRESVARAAQEYRDERTLEVSTSSESTTERVERRMISNPNTELTVTYLLYELQRRFEVAGRLQAARPVVMVAFEVPAPHEITEAWLLANEWVLRRVILDDGLLPALDHLTDGFAGEELGVEILRVQWDAQMRAVDVMRGNAELSAGVRDIARVALQVASLTVAGRDGLIKNLGEALFPSGAEAEDVVSAQQEAAQRGLEWAMDDLVNQRQRMEATVTALERATADYVAALERRTDRRVAIDQLRIHVKDNILHYMQAIWAHEPPDQRYFRLYDLKVQWPERDVSAVTVGPRTRAAERAQGTAGSRTVPPGARFAEMPDVLAPGQLAYTVGVQFPAPRIGPTRPLHEVADLDELLGFRGNYAVFPLREANAITDYMAQDFLDSYFGVADPDPFGEMPTASQALSLAQCAWNREGTTDEDRAEITRWLLDVLAAQSRVAQEVVVPTGQLFMEALPGSHPLLEDFKLAHRAADVERAVADLRSAQVETLRRAARLAAGDLTDPDVEQRVEIVGTDASVTVPVPTVQAD